MSTHNIYFHGRIRKTLILIPSDLELNLIGMDGERHNLLDFDSSFTDQNLLNV